jgi:hypothetical protein
MKKQQTEETEMEIGQEITRAERAAGLITYIEEMNEKIEKLPGIMETTEEEWTQRLYYQDLRARAKKALNNLVSEV